MDNEYELRYLPLFYEDMYEKVTYIREELLNPEAADMLIDAVEEGEAWAAIAKELPNDFRGALNVITQANGLSQEEGMDTGWHPKNDPLDKDIEYTYSITISLVQMEYQTDFFVAIKKQLSYLIHAIAAGSCVSKLHISNHIFNFFMIESKSVIIDIKIRSIC